MPDYAQKITESQVKAGEAAIKYCIEQGLAGWYVVTRVKSGRGPSSKCLVSGPYTTINAADIVCTDNANFVEFLTTEEAKAITY
jgi:hypothetical protein